MTFLYYECSCFPCQSFYDIIQLISLYLLYVTQKNVSILQIYDKIHQYSGFHLALFFTNAISFSCNLTSFLCLSVGIS